MSEVEYEDISNIETLDVDDLIEGRYSGAKRKEPTPGDQFEEAEIEEADGGGGVFESLEPDPAGKGSYFGDNLDPEGPSGKSKKEEDPEDHQQRYKGSDGPSRKVEVQAEAIVKAFNAVSGIGAAMVAGEGTSKDYKPDEEDQELVEESLAVWLETLDNDIPPGWMLIIVVGMVYGPQWVKALKVRNEVKAGTYHRTQQESKDREFYKASTGKKETTAPGEEAELDEAEQLPELSEINEQAVAAGLEPIRQDDPPPSGMCHYHWYVLGEEVPAEMGKFYDRSASAKWAGMQRSYRSNGIEWPL